jgi:single-stranded-DNA-specific exonuclease
MTLSKRTRATTGDASFAETNAAIAELAQTIDPRAKLDEHAVSCGIAVFRELGFLTTSGFSTARRIEMVESPIRMDLNSSIRYIEGIKAREEFSAFSSWALSADADEMLRTINQPITPSFGIEV